MHSERAKFEILKEKPHESPQQRQQQQRQQQRQQQQRQRQRLALGPKYILQNLSIPVLYYDGESVSGHVTVTLKSPGKKLEHHGVKIELIGQIELFYDRGSHHEFTSLVKV